MFVKENGKLFYKFDNETVCIEPWGKNALRVRVTMNAEFTDKDWALIEPKAKEADITAHNEKVASSGLMTDTMYGTPDKSHGTITNGKITADISSLGVITFKNQKGEVLLAENWRRLRDNPSMSLNLAGRELKPIEGENFKVTLRFKANDKEKIFGMGQYQQTYLDMKGCSLELAHRNSQISIPFYISNIGYGFLWNNPAIGKVQFSKNGTEWLAESTKQADYWIAAGDTPAEIEESYADVVGKAPMMPDYGMGFWQCKLRYRTQDELMTVARKHKELGLPLDVIVADFFHWPKEGDFKFDSRFWPDVEGMCEELKSMGVELMVSIWPTVDFQSENYEEMMEKGFLVRTEKGVRVTMSHLGKTIFMDTTNPGTREFVWSKAKQNYWDKGVRIFWLDEAEPEYTAYDYENYRYYLGTDLEVGNIYPEMYAKGFYDGMKGAGMENPLNLLRCAWVGSQKYGALVWSGDIDSTFNSFQRQVRAGLSMAIAGIPWWTTDIGGFHGAATKDPEFKKLLLRWFEYGCFCPVFRLHGSRNPMLGAEEMMTTGIFPSGSDNEVWSYGEDAFEVMKKYLFLRERIRPYIAEQMKAAHEKGTPVIRPLFYDFSADEKAWEVDDQYMFGPDILVAPVIEEDAYERLVYLPSGAGWTNAWTGEKFDGGQQIKVDAPIDVIPLFLKDDADLPIKA
jgi:alpha-D-xyloside xylohydrolase